MALRKVGGNPGGAGRGEHSRRAEGNQKKAIKKIEKMGPAVITIASQFGSVACSAPLPQHHISRKTSHSDRAGKVYSKAKAHLGSSAFKHTGTSHTQ